MLRLLLRPAYCLKKCLSIAFFLIQSNLTTLFGRAHDSFDEHQLSMSAVMLGHRSQLRSRSRSRQSSVSACCEGVEDCLGTHLICCTDETCEETLPTSNSSSASSASSSLLTENKSRDLENEQDCPECRDGFPAEVVCCTGDKCLEVEEECAECEKDNETVQIEGKEDANLVPCDVPGCSVLEWDEKTVNELVCCRLCVDDKIYCLLNCIYGCTSSGVAVVVRLSTIINLSQRPTLRCKISIVTQPVSKAPKP